MMVQDARWLNVLAGGASKAEQTSEYDTGPRWRGASARSRQLQCSTNRFEGGRAAENVCSRRALGYISGMIEGNAENLARDYRIKREESGTLLRRKPLGGRGARAWG